MLTSRPEPVLLLDLVKAAVAVAASVGWVVLDDPTAQTLTTSLAGLLYLVLTYVTRSKVTPLADPVTSSGEMLVVRPTVADAAAQLPPADETDYGYGRAH